MNRFHVVTGGPGSGKTSLIEALAATGLRCMPEAGRAVIRAQLGSGGNALPWGDRAAFAGLMLAHDLRAHRRAAGIAGPVLFDRGIPDVIGYLRLCGLPVPAATMRAAEQRRYAARAFIAPHWPAIYRPDAERRQDEAEAAATAEAVAASWTALGYRLTPLPLASVAERVAFVRAEIGAGVG